MTPMPFFKRFLPKSLLGQMLLAVALALLVAQTISAVLQYRAAEQRREAIAANSLAFQLVMEPRFDFRRPASELSEPARRDAGSGCESSTQPNGRCIQARPANGKGKTYFARSWPTRASTRRVWWS